MIDVISYSTSNGVVTKTVTSVRTVTDLNSEITALQGQLFDFEASQAVLPTDEIAAAISNYETQIAILQGVS